MVTCTQQKCKVPFFPLSLSYVKHVVRRQAVLQRDAGEKEPMTNVFYYVLLGLLVYCWGYLCSVGLGLIMYCWGYLFTVGVTCVLLGLIMCCVLLGLGLIMYCWG